MANDKLVKTEIAVITQDQVEQKIYVVRGHKVMVDSDLASLYGVSTKRLNEQVRRNKERFPWTSPRSDWLPYRTTAQHHSECHHGELYLPAMVELIGQPR